MSLELERKRWEKETLKPASKRFPERKVEFNTSSGIPLPAIQIPADTESHYIDRLGFPGEYPFTRGGPCANTLAMHPPANLTSDIDIYSNRVRQDYQWLSICRLKSDMIRMILSPKVKLEKSVWLSPHWRTWPSCFGIFPLAMSPQA